MSFSRLILFTLIIATTFSQKILTVNNALSTPTTDSYLSIDDALASIDPSGSILEYTILIAPSTSVYPISFAYNLTGITLTFQTSDSAYTEGSYLASQSSCSLLPSVALNGSAITADTIAFNGIGFYMADTYNNSLELFPNGTTTLSDICFEFDSVTQYNQVEAEDTVESTSSSKPSLQNISIAIINPPNDTNKTYLLAVQGNQQTNLTIQNAFIFGQVLNPSFLWTKNVGSLEFNSIIATSFPMMSATTASITMTSFIVNGINSAQPQPYTIQATNPCLAKMSYYSFANLSNIEIVNLNVTSYPYFLCLYEVTPPSDQLASISQQNFQLDTFNFSNNYFYGVNSTWSIIYFRVLSGEEISQRYLSLTNINIENNDVTTNDAIWYDGYVFVLYPAGNITIENLSVLNNTNLKIVSATESNYLLSSLDHFQNCTFLNNQWTQGGMSFAFLVNPRLVDSGPSTISIFLRDITFANNLNLVNFFSLSNQQIYFDAEDAYVWPRAWLYNLNVANNTLNTTVLFGIQRLNLDFNDTIVYNNTFNSSEFIQSTSSPAPLQINNVTFDFNTLYDSSIIVKNFDTTRIASVMSTKLVNNTTPVPYSMFVNGFYLTNSTFSEYSVAFRVKGAPLLFITQSEFKDLSFNSSSTLISASDLLSSLENIIINTDVVVNQGYLTYLNLIDDDNVTEAYYQSLSMSISTEFELGYATDNFTNGLVFIYRIFQCEFGNMLFNDSNIIEVDTVLLNQSLVSVDQNNFTNITLLSFQDSILQTSDVSSLNFANNYFTQMQGLGAVLTTDMVQFLTVISNILMNNLGSSFLRMTADMSYSVLLKDNSAQNITCLATYISLEIERNYGRILIDNNTFDNFYIVSDPTAFRQLNFMFIDTETSISVQQDIPDVHIRGCSFTNSVIYKDHSLIKQYQNSFMNIILAEDLFRIENVKFDNISIQYDSNLLVAVTETLEIMNSTFSNIQNFEQYGSVYILAGSVFIDNSTFTNNNSPIGNGGAIFLDFDSVEDANVTFVLQNSNFSNNVAALGSVFYYTSKSINFTAYNNTFTDNTASNDGGSIILLGQTTFSQFVFEQNVIIYTQNVSTSMNILEFDSVATQDSDTIVSVNNLTINITGTVVGNFFEISSSDANFTISNLTVFGNPVMDRSTANSFSIMDLWSGSVLLQSAKIYNISSNGVSVLYLSCDGEANTILQVEDSIFSNFWISSDSETDTDVTDDDTNPNMGILHVSDKGGKTSCNNSLFLNNTLVENLNYGFVNDGDLSSSAITVDYSGQFTLDVQNSVFQNMAATNGSVLLLINAQKSLDQIDIVNNTFINTTAYMNGGAVYNGVNDMTFTENQFINTSSMQGSGASIFSDGPFEYSVVLESNNFTNVSRYSSHSFKDSHPLGSSPVIMNLTFKAPSYIVQNVSGTIKILSNFSTTDLPEVNITSNLLDAFGQVVYDTSTTEMNPKEVYMQIDGQYASSRLCHYGDCQLFEPNIDLKTYAGEVVVAEVFYKSTHFSVPTTIFNIIMRPCMVGEINTTLGNPNSAPQCRVCPEATYSLNPLVDIECHRCPDNANCLGGNNMIIAAGYWRANTSSDFIIECKNLDACLGGFNSTCEIGSIGPLCDSCDVANRWVKSSSVCAQCPPTGRSLIILAAIFFFTFGYQLWYIKCARVSNSFFIVYYGNQVDTVIGKKIDSYMTQGMYIRLLTTYAQIIAIIATFNLDFSQVFGDTFQMTAQAVANPTTSLFYSSTCAFLDSGLDSGYLIYYKIAFGVLSPFIKIGILFLFRLLTWKFTLSDKRKSILYITALCLFLQEQPSSAQQLFSFLNCIQLQTDGLYYLQQDLGYECYTPTYYSYRNFLVIPCLVIYTLLVPGILLGLLIMNKYRLNTARFRMNLGTIYNEYQSKAFFWGICLMGIKLVLMFLGSTLFNDVKTKAFSIFVALYIYYALYQKFQPYDKKELFYAENIALVNFLFTVFGSIYYKDNTIPGVQWLILVAIALLNLYVVGFLLWKIIRIYFMQIRDIVKPMWRNYRKKDVKLDVNFLDENFAAEEKENEQISLDKVEELIFGKDSKFWNKQPEEEEIQSPKLKRVGSKQKPKIIGPKEASIEIELPEL